MKPWLSWMELTRLPLFSFQRMHVEKKPHATCVVPGAAALGIMTAFRAVRRVGTLWVLWGC